MAFRTSFMTSTLQCRALGRREVGAGRCCVIRAGGKSEMGERREVVRRGLSRGDSTTFEAAGLGVVWCEPYHDTGYVVI